MLINSADDEGILSQGNLEETRSVRPGHSGADHGCMDVRPDDSPKLEWRKWSQAIE